MPSDDVAIAAIAAPLAAAAGAPLLPGPVEDVPDTVAELGDPEVRDLGAEAPSGDDDQPDRTALALAVAEELGADRFIAAAADRPADLAAAAAVAIRSDAAVLPVAPDADLEGVADDLDVVVLGTLDQFPDAESAEAPWPVDPDAAVAWVVDPADPGAIGAVTLAALRGDTVVPVSDGDLLASRTVDRVRGAGLTADRLVPVGSFTTDPAQDLPLLVDAPLLPGGTLRLFEGSRMVALYGTPGTAALGVLGEQDLEPTLDRAREVTEGYDADGREVVPTLEIIVSVASGSAEEDGSYSRVTDPENYREWVDRAGEEGMQVVLDLQPGRTDFLTQARIYEDLLREPHVGLALDPEWRLEDDQVHLEQIGSVEAAEVQEVVDWLAELTREEGQTQKLLVLHQFRLSMLQDRDTIELPREVVGLVHADGQGPQPQKLDTWRVLTAEGADQWHWGWKNFYDEDPTLATPDEILDLDPDVVFVTYQ